MPATIRRLFGYSEDATNGGKGYDELAAGAVPDASVFWPTTGGTLDKGLDNTERNDEVRGRRASSAPRPFRAAPMFTIPIRAYCSALQVALKKCLGGADTKTGASSPFTHEIKALGFGAANSLPAVHAQLVRDDLNHKLAGATFNRVSLAFPLDSEGTAEFELWGKYLLNDPASPPTAAFTGESGDVMMLRDASIKIDAESSAIPNLTNFEFAFVNNLTRKWFAGRNIVSQTLGSPSQVRKRWWPQENKMAASQDVTFSLGLGDVDTAQELALDYGRIEKFVFLVAGAPITGGTELLRITIYGGEHTDGGAEALTARDDITASYSGGAFYSDADSADIKVEIVNGLTELLK